MNCRLCKKELVLNPLASTYVGLCCGVKIKSTDQIQDDLDFYRYQITVTGVNADVLKIIREIIVINDRLFLDVYPPAEKFSVFDCEIINNTLNATFLFELNTLPEFNFDDLDKLEKKLRTYATFS